MAEQTGEKGLSWEDISQDSECVMLEVIYYLIAQHIVLGALALGLHYLFGTYDGSRKSLGSFFGSRTGNVPQKGRGKTLNSVNSTPSESDDLDYYFGYLGNTHNATEEGSDVARKNSSLALYLGKSLNTEDSGPSLTSEISAASSPGVLKDVREEENKVSHLHRIWGGQTTYWDNDYFLIAHDLTIDVKRGRQSRALVERMTFSIKANECFGIIGPNGSGKTAIMSVLSGFKRKSSGDVIVNGKSVEDRECLRVGTTMQKDFLWSDLTVRQHLLFYAKIKLESPLAVARSMGNVMNRLDLHGVADKLISRLSGGMKRRLSVAIALLGDPTALYLDEPFVGLDPYSRKVLMEMIRDIKKYIPVIIATSDIKEAEIICDRIGVIHNGRLRCIGGPKDLISRYGDYLWLTIVSPISALATIKKFVMATFPGSNMLFQLGGRQKFSLSAADNRIDTVFRKIEKARLENQIEIVDWNISNSSLEDVYFNIINV